MILDGDGGCTDMGASDSLGGEGPWREGGAERTLALLPDARRWASSAALPLRSLLALFWRERITCGQSVTANQDGVRYFPGLALGPTVDVQKGV